MCLTPPSHCRHSGVTSSSVWREHPRARHLQLYCLYGVEKFAVVSEVLLLCVCCWRFSLNSWLACLASPLRSTILTGLLKITSLAPPPPPHQRPLSSESTQTLMPDLFWCRAPLTFLAGPQPRRCRRFPVINWFFWGSSGFISFQSLCTSSSHVCTCFLLWAAANWACQNTIDLIRSRTRTRAHTDLWDTLSVSAN